MIITVDEFRSYNNFYEEDPNHLIDTYILAAEDVVFQYLGYNPEYKNYEAIYSGTGDSKLYLRETPVKQLMEVYINDSYIDPCYFRIKDNCIQHKLGLKVFKEGVDNIKVVYSAGQYTEDINPAIKLAVLRIASLMLAEANGNIGISGKAFGDNSRTFISYSNYDKYLKPVDPYRIINFGV